MIKKDERKTVRASAFLLDDDDGRTRAKLAMGEHGLHLYDEKGNIRVALEFDTIQSRLTLSDGKGDGFAGLHVTDDGKPKLFMHDEGKMRVELYAEEHLSALSLYDEEEKLRAVLAGPSPTLRETGEVVAGHFRRVVESGESSLYICDDKGKTSVQLIVTEDGPAVVLSDDKGSWRASLHVGQDGFPALHLRDSKGKIRARLALANDLPRLELYDERGAPRLELEVTEDGAAVHASDREQEARAELHASKEGSMLELREGARQEQGWIVS
jgi:hypothetical protein